MPRPKPAEYDPYFEHYVSLARADSVSELIMLYSDKLIRYIDMLPDNKANYAYAAGKWTIKESLQHLIDAERIFTYRALAIARGETQPLPGFNPAAYGNNQYTLQRSFDDLKEEFRAVRYASNMLFRSFDAKALETTGPVAGTTTSCRAWIYITFGHALHHLDIFNERYFS